PAYDFPVSDTLLTDAFPNARPLALAPAPAALPFPLAFAAPTDLFLVLTSLPPKLLSSHANAAATPPHHAYSLDTERWPEAYTTFPLVQTLAITHDQNKAMAEGPKVAGCGMS